MWKGEQKSDCSLSLQIGVSLCPCVCMYVCVWIYSECASRCMCSTQHGSALQAAVPVCTCAYYFLFFTVFSAFWAENRTASLISASSRACGLWRNEVSTCFYSRCAFNLLSLKIHTHTHKQKKPHSSSLKSFFKGAFKIAKCPDIDSYLQGRNFLN